MTYHWSTYLVYIHYMCLASAAVVDLNVNANADEGARGMRGGANEILSALLVCRSGVARRGRRRGCQGHTATAMDAIRNYMNKDHSHFFSCGHPLLVSSCHLRFNLPSMRASTSSR